MNDLLLEKSILRKYQQLALGWLFLLVTPLSILPGVPFDRGNPVGWWHSVSETYYASSGIVMISVFMMIAVISITFCARNPVEKTAMFFLGIGSAGVVMFPHAYKVLETTGFFQLNGETSIKFHFIFAAVCFISECALALIFSFIPEETEKKHERNVLYLSSWVLIGLSAIVIAVSKKIVLPEWTTLFMEFIMFSLFGADLLCCAGKIPFLM